MSVMTFKQLTYAIKGICWFYEAIICACLNCRLERQEMCHVTINHVLCMLEENVCFALNVLSIYYSFWSCSTTDESIKRVEIYIGYFISVFHRMPYYRFYCAVQVITLRPYYKFCFKIAMLMFNKNYEIVLITVKLLLFALKMWCFDDAVICNALKSWTATYMYELCREKP